MTQHNGLPVSGYRPQSEDAVSLVNRNKEIEERVLRIFDELGQRTDIDGLWLAIGRNHIEQGFMAMNRAVFQPGRVTIIEKTTPEEAFRAGFLGGYAMGMDHDHETGFDQGSREALEAELRTRGDLS